MKKKTKTPKKKLGPVDQLGVDELAKQLANAPGMDELAKQLTVDNSRPIGTLGLSWNHADHALRTLQEFCKLVDVRVELNYRADLEVYANKVSTKKWWHKLPPAPEPNSYKVYENLGVLSWVTDVFGYEPHALRNELHNACTCANRYEGPELPYEMAAATWVWHERDRLPLPGGISYDLHYRMVEHDKTFGFFEKFCREQAT